MSPKTERNVGIAVFAIGVAIAAWLRLRNLDLKPLHSDEGVNGWFLMNLYNSLTSWPPHIRYKYDPTNYHGPFLYFAGLVPFFLGGPSNVTLRLLPAIAGIGCVAVLWPIRKWLGWAGLAAASFLLALSPPFVYFSRTAIHEIYVFFFSLAAVVCFVRTFAGTGTGLPDAPRWHRNWILFGFISAALVFTNKETAVITFASFVGAAAIAWFFSTTRGSEVRAKRDAPTLVTWIGTVLILAGTFAVAWTKVKGSRPLRFPEIGELERHFLVVVLLGVATAIAWFVSTRNETFHFLSRARRLADVKPKDREEGSDFGLAVAWAAAITVILFTSFFNNPRGAWDMFATYGTWVGRGHEGAGHEKPFVYWLELLWEFDAPILVLAFVGTVAAMFRRDRFSLFIAAWAWSQWLVYSVISYKTPWLNLNFTGPMCILGGIALRELAARVPAAAGRVAMTAAVPAAIALWPVPAGPVLAPEDPEGKITTWWRFSDDVNFRHYDDDRYKIIYVQTVRDFETMVSKIEKMFDHHGEALTVWVTSGDYWPLPFYLREHDKTVGYHQGKIPSGTPASVIVSSSTQDAELRPKLVGWRQEQYMLRPGVVLSLWVEPAVWDPVFGAPVESEPIAEAPADPSQLAGGLVAEYRYGIGCTGEVLARRVEPQPTYGGGGGEREFRAPVCVRWRGFLRIEETDEYAFRTASDDGSWVFVDGQLALDNGGAHGPLPLAGVLRKLEAGLHPIEVRYFDAGGGAMLDVGIRRRGSPERSLAGMVFHDPRTVATPGGS